MIDFFEVDDRFKFILLAIAGKRKDFQLLRSHLKREIGKEISNIEILCYETELFVYKEKVVRVHFYFETRPNLSAIDATFRRDGISVEAYRYFLDDKERVKKINRYIVVDGKVKVEKDIQK